MHEKGHICMENGLINDLILLLGWGQRGVNDLEGQGELTHRLHHCTACRNRNGHQGFQMEHGVLDFWALLSTSPKEVC